MKLTKKNKNFIDSLSYRSLLYHWRFASSIGVGWFGGATGVYWFKHMNDLRDKIGEDSHNTISKSVGW